MKTGVQWLEWSQRAFDTAKKENKPVLLDLSAVWCHWCHRMDADCYENEEIASIINSRFVPIRVDIDERPDIKERYHAGGFPTTGFLDCAGNKLLAGTYFPPHELKALLGSVADNFQKIVEQKNTKISAKSPSTLQPVELNKQIVDALVNELIMTADLAHGGWGQAPKFPLPAAIDAALALFQKTGDPKLLEVIVKTLKGMQGIYDQEEGGFFRYAVQLDWTEPHYEKMLETNVGLLRNYVHGLAMIKDQEYRKIAQGIVNYIAKNLTDPAAGGFFASQDADESYYALSLEGRKARKAPYIDKTIFVNLNAQAISAHLDAAQILGDEGVALFALKTLDMILSTYVSEDGVAHCSHQENGKRESIRGLFSDTVFLATACIDAYEATFEQKYRTAALDLAKGFEKFYDPTEKIFRDRQPRTDDIGDLTKPRFDFFENIAAVDLLLRLGDHTESEALQERARSVLRALAPHAPPYSVHGAGFAMTVERMLTGFVVHVVGLRATIKDSPLMPILRAVLLPKSIVLLDVHDDSTLLQQKGYSLTDKPTAYVCYKMMCRPPATDADRLKKILASIMKEVS